MEGTFRFRCLRHPRPALPDARVAHATHIVHRDTEAREHLRRPDGTVKLLDFLGIARVRDALSGDERDQHGVLLGTPAFMALEQARGEGERDRRGN